jgi:methyl-accepting chemotaxis protein
MEHPPFPMSPTDAPLPPQAPVPADRARRSPFRLDSVSKRFLAPTIALLALLLLGLSATIVWRNSAFTARMSATHGEAVTDLLAQVARGSVSYFDLQELDHLADEARKDPNIRYVAFFDEAGRPLTEREGLPEEPAAAAGLERYARAFQDEDGRALGSMVLVYSHARALESAQANVRVLGAGVALVLALFVLGMLVVTRRVLGPIRALTRATREVVRTGDLRQEILVESEDEVGELAHSFREMVAKMRAALGSLQASSQQLDASVVALSTATDAQGRSVTRQAAALQQAQVTTAEIQRASLTAAQQAAAVLQSVARADEVSRRGGAAVEQSLAGLAEIQGQVEEMARRMGQLGARAQQIAAITQTVKDLADQSNMLALNAAIEAMRAGEHGKGFGVVAREIRSLADQSIGATAKVREVLEDLTDALGATVQVAEQGARKVAAGLEQVGSSGASLRELSLIVQESSGSTRQIAAAVAQQDAGIAQISSAVQQLAALMEETRGRLEQVGEAGIAVENVSLKAASVVADYRV